jgi:lysophospholipase L1-like esterase
VSTPPGRSGRPRALLLKLALAASGGILALLVAELTLRASVREVHDYYVWWPFLEETFRVAPGTMPGISGETHFRVNSLGLRGDELLPEHDLRLLAVGGSSTECLFLDQEDAWPARVQAELDRRQERQRAWVGNAGKSGLTTRDHVVQLRHLVPQVPELDRVILLTGVNDLTLRLSQDENYWPRPLDEPAHQRLLLQRSFQMLPIEAEERLEPHERTALWRLVGRFKDALLPRENVQDDAGRIYETWRDHRRSSSGRREHLPDLASALAEYRANLELASEICREHGVRLLLLTQPALWSEDLSSESEDLLWFGGVGDFMKVSGCEYYSVAALREGLEAYNATLLAVAEEQGVECLDLARAVSGNEAWFYDDVHFNVAGSRRVAELVAAFLLESEPFSTH